MMGAAPQERPVDALPIREGVSHPGCRLVSAIASACCTLPAMGVLVAYSGTRQDINRRAAVASAVWFVVGTTLALIILGIVAGLIGQAAQAFLGRYWKLFAGAVAVLFGLATLKLLPFKMPRRAANQGDTAASGGRMGAVLGGLFLGGGVTAVSLPCNPGIYINTRRGGSVADRRGPRFVGDFLTGEPRDSVISLLKVMDDE